MRLLFINSPFMVNPLDTGARRGRVWGIETRAVLDELDDLFGGWNLMSFHIVATVFFGLVQEVAVVDHKTTCYGQSTWCRVGQPVDSPQHGPIPQVEISWKR